MLIRPEGVPGPAPAASQRPVLSSPPPAIRRRGPLDEASTRVQAIQPSGLPLAWRPRTEREPLGLSPELRTPPTKSRRRTSRWGQAIEHGPGTTRSTSHQSILQSCVLSLRATSRRTAWSGSQLVGSLVAAFVWQTTRRCQSWRTRPTSPKQRRDPCRPEHESTRPAFGARRRPSDPRAGCVRDVAVASFARKRQSGQSAPSRPRRERRPRSSAVMLALRMRESASRSARALPHSWKPASCMRVLGLVGSSSSTELSNATSTTHRDPRGASSRLRSHRHQGRRTQ